MSRYIDADNMKTTKSIQSADFNSIETIQKWIDEQPTADVTEIKHGHWTNNKGEIVTDFECPVWCSECEKWANTQTPYCPNCGAKMDQEEVKE